MAENAAGTEITPETFELGAAQNDTIIIADQRVERQVETLGALTTVNTPAPTAA